jgi:2-Cys peroxiredoxin 5
VGDAFPDVVLHENAPANKVSTKALMAGKRVAVFGVPGAFTPGCSKTHLPGFVADAEKFKAKGVDELVCVSVNDSFVMEAWGKSAGAEGHVRLLADPRGELGAALGVLQDKVAALGNMRLKRFSAFVEDGTIKVWNVEPDGGGLTCTLANPLLKAIPPKA